MRRSETLTLPVSQDEARAACRGALSPQVWEVEEDGVNRLVAHEWPWRVSCQVRPARLEISIGSVGSQRTMVRLDASMAGIGPIPSRHLRLSLEALAAAIASSVR